MSGFNYEKDANGVVTVTMDMDGPVNSMSEAFLPALRDTVEKLEAEGIEDFDAYRMLVKGEEARHAYESGDWSRGILSLGPAIAFADRIEPAATIIRRLITEACDAREHLTGLTTTRAWAH